VYVLAHVYMCVVSSPCPVYYSSPTTMRLPYTTMANPSHTTRSVFTSSFLDFYLFYSSISL